MKYFLHWIPLLFITSTLIARMGGLPLKVLNNFTEQAASSALVVVGKPIHIINGYPELLDLYDGHRFYYLKVTRVLAASSAYLKSNGEVDIPEYLLISDNLDLDLDSYAVSCNSVFLLWPVFSGDDGRRLDSSRELVSKVLKEHKVPLDASHVFELASGEEVFPVVDYQEYKADPANAYLIDDETEELWSYQQSKLKEYWGLSDFTEVEGFVEIALLPFFQQIDTDWFCSRVDELGADSPLWDVAKAFQEERKPARGGPDYDRRIGLVRRPFTGGEVLNRSNLAGTFPESTAQK